MLLASILFCILIALLTHTSLGRSYVLSGLGAWYQNAIPALFPFLVVSGIIIRMGLEKRVIRLLYPVIKRFFKASERAAYVIFIGVLCGFPMGARTVNDLYEKKALSLQESRWLLSFTNHLGPAFFFAILLPLFPGLKTNGKLLYFLGAYGIPLLYGAILRRTLYRGMKSHKEVLIKEKQRPGLKLSDALAASLKSAVDAMLSIGGYLLFFSLLNVIPEILLGRAVLELSPLLEITTGLVRIGNAHPLYSLACFTFGGLSCMAQTKACLRTSELKDFMTEYVFHKCVLTLVCTAYFFFLEFLPDFPT